MGKVFKPDLRKLAMARVLNADLAEAGLDAHVAVVFEDKKRGLVAKIAGADAADPKLAERMDRFALPWDR